MSSNIKKIYKSGIEMYRLVIITERRELIVSEHWSEAGARSALLSFFGQQQALELVA